MPFSHPSLGLCVFFLSFFSLKSLCVVAACRPPKGPVLSFFLASTPKSCSCRWGPCPPPIPRLVVFPPPFLGEHGHEHQKEKDKLPGWILLGFTILIPKPKSPHNESEMPRPPFSFFSFPVHLSHNSNTHTLSLYEMSQFRKISTQVTQTNDDATRQHAVLHCRVQHAASSACVQPPGPSHPSASYTAWQHRPAKGGVHLPERLLGGGQRALVRV